MLPSQICLDISTFEKKNIGGFSRIYPTATLQFTISGQKTMWVTISAPCCFRASNTVDLLSSGVSAIWNWYTCLTFTLIHCFGHQYQMISCVHWTGWRKWPLPVPDSAGSLFLLKGSSSHLFQALLGDYLAIGVLCHAGLTGLLWSDTL